MLSIKLLTLLGMIFHAAAFVPAPRMIQRPTVLLASQHQEDFLFGSKNKVAATVAGLSTGAFFQAAVALAEEDYEIAELPPPYVPVIFAVVLLGGVGFLTGSLGDVMTEGN